jgi:hypothetical protein
MRGREGSLALRITSTSCSLDNADLAAVLSARAYLDEELHVLPQCSQEPHEPITGEAVVNFPGLGGYWCSG